MTLMRYAGRRTGLAVLVLLVCASVAVAQSYGLVHGIVTGGGSLQTTDSSFGLTGSIAQAGAGPVMSDGGNYTLSGGFWVAGVSPPPGGPSPQNVYLPIIIRNTQ